MIEYEFWDQKTHSGKDAASVNDLLSLLTAAPTIIFLSGLNRLAQNSKLLLARDSENSQIVGMATLAIFLVPTGKCGRIEDVVVDGGYRRRGIGKTLVKRLITEAKKLRLKKIDLTSRPERVAANRLYQTLGFERVKTNPYRLNLKK